MTYLQTPWRVKLKTYFFYSLCNKLGDKSNFTILATQKKYLLFFEKVIHERKKNKQKQKFGCLKL